MDKIIHGDCLDALTQLPDNSVDLVVTDPPYGYSFMGKDWDKAVPSVEIWKETLRVLKPGAFAFVMSAPRQDVLSQMIVRIGEAGFDTDFTSIYWTYASGFPKAMNIGKMVDKRNGRDPEQFKEFAEHYAQQRRAKNLTHALICEAGKFYDTHNHGGASTNWEKGHNVPTLAQWRILQPLLDLSSEFLPLIEREEAEREVISRQEITFGVGGASARLGAEKIIDKPATPQAKALDGSYGGFQPKPAVEVIIVAMKPLSEKTFVDQALKNGKGVTWLDDCRVPAEPWSRPTTDNIKGGNYGNSAGAMPIARSNDTGRFPANLLVSDDVLNDGTVKKAARSNSYKGDKNGYDGGWGRYEKHAGYADDGSYSRYFDLDAWAKTYPFLIVPKASKREKNEGLEAFEARQVTGGGGGIGDYLDDVNSASGKYGSEKAPARNYHPTVKPLKLMSYLIVLGSREGDVVLDPFCGSGTTPLAAYNLNRHYIGIERELEYVNIARARLAFAPPYQPKLVA
jgi:DNA modification methylase